MRRVVFAVVLLMVISPLVIGAQELGAKDPQLGSSIDTADIAGAQVAAPSQSASSAVPSSVTRRKASIPLGSTTVTGDKTQFVDRSLTRVRLLLDTTSTHARLDLQGFTIAEHRVISASRLSALQVQTDGIVIDGAGSAEVLAVLRVPDNASPRIGVKKNPAGVANGKVYRSNEADLLIVQIANTSATGADMYRSITRDTLVGIGLQIPRLDSRRLTLAYYYPWFNSSTFSKGLWWEKPAGPYDTTDPTQVQAMVSQAAYYGVNGFVYSWVNGEDSDRRLQYVIQAARNQGNFVVAAAIRLTSDSYGEDTKDTGRIVSSIKAVLRYSSDPVFLKVDGRPVIFMYASRLLTPSQWRSIKSSLSASGLNPFVMGDTADEDMQFDGMYLYNPNVRESDGLARKYRRVSEKLRLPWAVDSSYKRRLWAAAVSPGLNDAYRNPTSPRSRSREDGARYDATWEAALGSLPEWVLVTSYNEWFEATHISPGTKTGYRALQQTRNWASVFSRS